MALHRSLDEESQYAASGTFAAATDNVERRMAYTFQKVSPVFADEYHEGARRRAVSGAEGSREPQKGFVAQGLLGAGPERPGKRPKLAPAQVGTLRLRLLKLGAGSNRRFGASSSTCRSARRSPMTGAASRARSVLLWTDPMTLPGLQYKP